MTKTGKEQNSVSEQLDDFPQPLGRFLGRDNAVHLVSERDSWRPPVNIRKAQSRYVVEVELPGFAPEDVCVDVNEGVLRVSCTRYESDGEQNVIRRERPLGKFQRNFKLPEKIVATQVSAHMQAGVLLIKVPRTTTQKTNQIDIT